MVTTRRSRNPFLRLQGREEREEMDVWEDFFNTGLGEDVLRRVLV